MIKRLLVPLDAAESTEDVLPIVAVHAGAGATVRLVHVAELPDTVETAQGRVVAYADQEMAGLEGLWSDVLGAVAARVPGAVDYVVRFGDPVAEILTEAEAFGADAILVTTGTRSSVKRALLGSVAEAILRRAPTSVLLYRAPRESRTQAA